ncbi:TMhelix containing protein [Vibrio phage 2.275.O._10N.286.54.E11]|nr:TMhelix containing protein [Vibrio phage 2.275.O._10N.286.54.E11]
MSKAKKAAEATSKATKGAVKGVGKGLLGGLQSIWKFGGKWLLLANAFSFLCVAGIYNWIAPEYTVVGYFQNAIQSGDPLSNMVGMSIVTLLLFGAIGYMANNTKRSLGWIGLIFMSTLIGLVGFWMFTLGTFDGASTAFLATIAQIGVSFVLAFGLVYAKIDKIITGRVNTDSYDVGGDDDDDDR